MKWQNGETGMVCESDKQPSHRHIPYDVNPLEILKKERYFQRFLIIFTIVCFTLIGFGIYLCVV